MSDLGIVRAAWYQEVTRLRGEILRNPVADAVRKLSITVFSAYERETGELRAQLARTQAELDQAERRKVLLCMARNMEQAARDSSGEEPGTRLRATDTMETWELGSDRIWHEI